MASSRVIRQNFYNNPFIAKYNIDERYLLIGLVCAADDFGRFWSNLSNLKSIIYPTDNIPIEWIKDCIDKFISDEVLCNYIVDDVEYLHLPLWFEPGFALKQKIDHPREYRCPDCPVCRTEELKRKKMQLTNTRKFAGNIIKTNSIKDNTIKTKLNNDQSILGRFNDRIVRDNLLSRYPLLDISQYTLILDEYIQTLNDHNRNKQNHERLFETKLKEAQVCLEKEAA